MSEKSKDGSNVLPFKRVVKPFLSSVKTDVSKDELRGLLPVYDHLIAILRESDDDGLDILTNGLLKLVVQCREALENEVDEVVRYQLLHDMRAELHQFPRNLRSILPGIGPRLGESIEYKLGVQFAKF